MNQEHTYKPFLNKKITSFPYQEYGIKGVGKNGVPIVSMDQYIDHSNDDELHIECCKGLALANDYKMGAFYGGLPPEERVKFNMHDSWSEMLMHLQDYDPTGKHYQAIQEIINSVPDSQVLYAVYKYMYFAVGSVIPWFFALYLRKNDFFTKTENKAEWTDDIKYFPKLKKYIENLPMKNIGRVLFFTTYPNAGVVTHRDSVVEEHKDHNINLFFSSYRPSFIWDEIKKEKVYLPKGSKSYFFNNRDYHGVDPEPVFRYTIRVDGTFTDEICDALGLEDGYTWKWDYQSTK